VKIKSVIIVLKSSKIVLFAYYREAMTDIPSRQLSWTYSILKLVYTKPHNTHS